MEAISTETLPEARLCTVCGHVHGPRAEAGVNSGCPAPWLRWCGICFSWRVEYLARCMTCGNAHMRGGYVPPPASAQ